MPVTTIRLLTSDDAATLAELAVANRAFLAPTEPFRDEDYFTVAGQLANIERSLAAYKAGTAVPCVILADDAVVGQISFSNVVRGPLQSASLGYWISHEFNGQGIATAAVAAALLLAYEDLGLHRVEAGTLVDNHGSQRVLLKNGFVRYGLAPKFLLINGEWRDHVLFQRLAE